MATQVTLSIGSRTTNSVTVSTVTGTNPYTVTLSAAVPGTCGLGDKITDSTTTNKYLITAISGSQLTVSQYPWNAGVAPATGAAVLSRAFADINAWEVVPAANLTTVTVNGTAGGVLYKGECWNDSEFVPGSFLWIHSSTTTSATCFKWLSAAPGQSFADNVNKVTNALKYNAANGVGINTSALSGLSGIVVGEAFCKIDRLQFKSPGTNGGVDGVVRIDPAGASVSIIGNILQTTTTYDGPCFTGRSATGHVVVNNLCIYMGINVGGARGILLGTNGATAHQVHNNTCVCCSDKIGADGIHANTTTNSVVKNNACFGFTTGFNGTFDASSSNNASDSTTVPGTAGQPNLVYASQFQGTTSTSPDFRALSTSALKGNGVTDVTYTAGLDIIGQARSASTPTIGAWEVAVVVATLVAVPATTATSASVPAISLMPRNVTFTARDETGTLLTSLTGYFWAWYDVAPWDATKPKATDVGSGLTTNGSGIGVIVIVNSTKTSGQNGYALMSNSDGTTTQSPAARGFVCAATVD